MAFEAFLAVSSTLAVVALLWATSRGHSFEGWRLYVGLGTIGLLLVDALVHLYLSYSGMPVPPAWMLHLLYAGNLSAIAALMLRSAKRARTEEDTNAGWQSP